ncbi:MAG: ketopantoate reductase family protein [Rhodospirillales bacterium]
MDRAPDIAIVGAGATGIYLAARLAAAGMPVAIVARGASVDAIRRDGLRIAGPGDAATAARPARVVAEGETPPRVGTVVFMVKSYDTAAAVAWLPRLLADGGIAVTLQNGVENEAILAAAVGADRVIPGVLYIGVERTGPGAVRATTGARVVMGTGEGAFAPRAAALCAAFRAAGIECAQEPAMLRAKWQKFLFNCGLNPLTALAGRRLGAILADPNGAALFEALVSEAFESGRAAGAPIDDSVRDAVMAHARRTDISSSMAEDLAAGRPLESDAFGGTVRRLAARHGVPVPTTETVARLLDLVARGRG